jgi:predicted nucleotidyltransferase
MTDISSIISKETSKELPEDIQFLVKAIIRTYGDAVCCILFYGSCLRNGNVYDGIVDFYVIVNSYCKAYKNRFFTLLNSILPPNVFYIEVANLDGKTLRAKYSIFSLKHIKKMTTLSSFNPYLWARLVQPVRIVFTKDEDAKEIIEQSILKSATTFLTKVLPCLPTKIDSKTLWDKAFLLTYKTEIRPENKNTVVNIYKSNPIYFDNILMSTIKILSYPINIKKSDSDFYLEVHITKRIRIFYYITWFIRIIEGKILTFLRLIKSLFTFKGALSYGYYKLSKHTPDVVIPKIIKKSLFFSCLYTFFASIKRQIIK